MLTTTPPPRPHWDCRPVGAGCHRASALFDDALCVPCVNRAGQQRCIHHRDERTAIDSTCMEQLECLAERACSGDDQKAAAPVPSPRRAQRSRSRVGARRPLLAGANQSTIPVVSGSDVPASTVVRDCDIRYIACTGMHRFGLRSGIVAHTMQGRPAADARTVRSGNRKETRDG